MQPLLNRTHLISFTAQQVIFTVLYPGKWHGYQWQLQMYIKRSEPPRSVLRSRRRFVLRCKFFFALIAVALHISDSGGVRWLSTAPKASSLMTLPLMRQSLMTLRVHWIRARYMQFIQYMQRAGIEMMKSFSTLIFIAKLREYISARDQFNYFQILLNMNYNEII